VGVNHNISAIVIADAFGILLTFVMLTGNAWKIQKRDWESKLMFTTILTVLFTCAIDPFSFILDGKPGAVVHVITYFMNFWLFFSNMIIGPTWIIMVVKHITGFVSKKQKIFIGLVSSIGLLGLLVNFIWPVVFYIDQNNVYSRGPLFWMYFVLQGVYIIYGTYIYINSILAGGLLKFFPVWQFILPIIVGIIIQAVFYGVSTIWPCLAISMTSIVSSIQNETVFTDQLTGLYSRFYLDTIKQRISKSSKNPNITAMMLDMNGFKSINDRFGHGEGDRALVLTAGVLKRSVGNLGSVIRYAGDEFIILLNTQQKGIVEQCIFDIKAGLEECTKKNNLEYQLSISIGYSVFDMSKQTIDELMNIIDQRMYADKEIYYKEKGRRII